MLSARAGRAVDLHFDVLGPDVDLGLLHLGQDGDRRRRGMDAAAGLGLRHALHPVDAGLKFQAGIRALARNFKIGLLDAAELRLVVVEQTAPCQPRRCGVHACTCGRGCGRTGPISSPPTPPRISMMTLLSSFGSRGSSRILSSCSSRSQSCFAAENSSWQRALSSGSPDVHQLARVGHRLLGGLVCAIGLDDRLELLLFFQQLGRGLGIGVKIGLRGPFFHFHVAFFDKTQFFQHRDSSQFNIISIISHFSGYVKYCAAFCPYYCRRK